MVSWSVKGQKQTSLPDRDGKQIDSFGHRFYSMRSLSIKGCNYLACMARFVYSILEDFSDILSHLPDDVQTHIPQLQLDGLSAVLATDLNLKTIPRDPAQLHEIKLASMLEDHLHRCGPGFYSFERTAHLVFVP